MSENQPSGDKAVDTPGGDSAAGAEPRPTIKTPFFHANHALRYQRQTMIQEIQRETKRTLICYIGGRDTSIDRDDTVGFVDLLNRVEPGSDLDLMLHTTGGDVDAAEKLIYMVRQKMGEATLRVVVPDFAKSAGTLIALGADYIIMSDSSELGPIDPQVHVQDGKGGGVWCSAQSYMDAYSAQAEALRADPGDSAARAMLTKMDPVILKSCESAKNRARGFAEKQLRRWMFRKEGNWSLAAGGLLDTQKWQSHGQLISWEDAMDPGLGLSVEHLPAQDPAWQRYWALYCHQRLAIKEDEKLFESDYVSLIVPG